MENDLCLNTQSHASRKNVASHKTLVVHYFPLFRFCWQNQSLCTVRFKDWVTALRMHKNQISLNIVNQLRV